MTTRIVPETPPQRTARLRRTAAQQHIRATKAGEDVWHVTSGTRPDAPPYVVELCPRLGLVCSCPHGLYHRRGPDCKHIGRVRDQMQREARETSRILARMDRAYLAFCEGITGPQIVAEVAHRLNLINEGMAA